ncbi:hypothetical protein KBTX_01509 [wastewater metagenome]|uniref:Glutaredoxin-like domain n=2 Tax=unclassified sequences TaxID=12908 RepID=A0A5B8R8Z0_9ZZZZ|nr:glutaredoxin family protein [Arhodomonas sp. KWT]QEA05190.1 hypothetical protein KBTEX_01509 [uncultured organism]
MSVIGPVEFYMTVGCGLCDEAMAMLQPIAQRLAIDVQVRDVLDDPDWETRYGVRIPVLRRGDTGAEIGWPFDDAALYRFLL